ncbi:hypothetical protein TNCV_1919941 [Trichonephila clavipes]|nr:hypothetical protein TNCV_1919941 [Trichonephila clavipes]
MAPYRRKKPAPTDLSTDQEDMITYDVEEDELEQHPDLVQKDEIAEIVAKEPLEKSDDYPQIKNLLFARFQLTPIALRDRFESHQGFTLPRCPSDLFLLPRGLLSLVSAVPGFLPDDRHTASLVGLRGGWRHARMKLCTRIYGSNAAVPG